MSETGDRGAQRPSTNSTDEPVGSTAVDQYLRLVDEAERRRRRPIGLSPRAERLVAPAGFALIGLLIVGWSWAFFHARTDAEANGEVESPAAAVAAALTNPNAASTAYLTGAALDLLTDRMLSSQQGSSGRVQAAFTSGGGISLDTIPPGAVVKYANGADTASQPTHSGVWQVVLAVGKAIQPVADFSVISMLPFSAKQRGRIGSYLIGNWPGERGARGPSKAPAGRYANPPGFIEVTQDNQDTRVSDHFVLGDFLTHDQPNVWPKYLVLSTKLVDKLELVLEDLEAHGIDTRGVKIMSGFRTPQYNAGGGETNGRAELSRHMYGDASDIYIDDDHNGVMDDLNHDGKVNVNDSRVILAAEDRVERAHPELVGGGGVYPAAAGHGPFIHIDTRGYRARW